MHFKEGILSSNEIIHVCYFGVTLSIGEEF